MNPIFCSRIKELRLEKQMRQSDLAARLHIAPNTVSSWERGNSAPSIDELKELTQVFGTTADYLLGLRDEY